MPFAFFSSFLFKNLRHLSFSIAMLVCMCMTYVCLSHSLYLYQSLFLSLFLYPTAPSFVSGAIALHSPIYLCCVTSVSLPITPWIYIYTFPLSIALCFCFSHP